MGCFGLAENAGPAAAASVGVGVSTTVLHKVGVWGLVGWWG